MSRRVCSAAAVALIAGCSSTTTGAADHPAARPSAPPSAGRDSTRPAAPSNSGSSGTSSAPFTCTSRFVTTLSGYPVADQVSHYPVPRLTPSPHGLAGSEGMQALRSGELDVVFNRESTGLSQGPSRAMYACFVARVRAHGWAPDSSQNKVYRKQHKPGAPLLFSFYDSGSRFKAGNELTVRWFTSKANFGLGALISVVMAPHQHVPDLPPR